MLLNLLLNRVVGKRGTLLGGIVSEKIDQLLVGVDLSAIGGVLKVMLLDVLADKLGSINATAQLRRIPTGKLSHGI